MQEALSSVSANPRISMPYPHLRIEGLTDALTIVIDSLAEGDLPLMISYQGRLYHPKDISRSPLVISKLLRLTSVTLYRNESESVEIHNNLELMEVGII